MYQVFTLEALKQRWTASTLFKYRLKHFVNNSLNGPVIWESNKKNEYIDDVGKGKYDKWFVHEFVSHNDSNIVDIYIAKSEDPTGDRNY